MCGISLIIDSEGILAGKAVLEPALERMQQQQVHRGPDSGGAVLLPWARSTAALGSRRLHILGATPESDQPMERSWGSKKGRLSYNGELYNYADLRNELLRLGCSFTSSSDTEVVLYALMAWGREALLKFSGMFALVYYEEETGKESPTILIARDRWGQKPIYYTQQSGYWLAASELQGLLASGLVKKQLNQRQVYNYLRYKFATRPQTFYKDVFELEPGHYLQLSPFAGVVEGTFAAPPSIAAIEGPFDRIEVVEKVEELLVDALLTHLQSDKPVGMFLSGGVDSTLMLALLQKHAAWQLPVCFTIGQGGEGSPWGTDDYKWAEKAASQYGAYHHPLQLDESQILGKFTELAGQQDQPVGDGAWLLTYLLSEHTASTKVKVVLSGAGADELFAGYNRHSAFSKYLDSQGLLKPFLPLLRSGSRLLPSGMNIPGRKQWQLLKKFGRNVESNPYQTFLNFTSLSILANSTESLELSPAGDPLQWALAHDRQHYLISDVLALNDRASMQWGLEMRMPYLDQPLSEYVTRLPANYLLKGGRKWLLQDLLQQQGGKAYTRRRKEGFGMPFGAWVKQGKTDFLWQWLQQKEHPLHEVLPPAVTQELLNAHRLGRADYSQELMALALLSHWLEKHFR